jgi:hypothetical protein
MRDYPGMFAQNRAALNLPSIEFEQWVIAKKLGGLVFQLRNCQILQLFNPL